MCGCIVAHFARYSNRNRSPHIFANGNKKACKYRYFSLILQAFVVAAAKVADSHCLLLEELSHTDLIDQPAFLFCLVDHIARLAVPAQKRLSGVVHTHILRHSHTAGVGVAV